MPLDISDWLVVGISSSALFDLEVADNIFRSQGLQAFIDHQRENEGVVLRPGAAFGLIKGLLALNDLPNSPKVEVILMSRNHPDVSLRVFKSIEHYGLNMSRAALTGGAPLGPYLRAFNVGLFLSQCKEDVQMAANEGFAAGLIYPPPPVRTTENGQIRIAFDGDCVLFSDEAQKVYDKNKDITAFHKHEVENANRKLPDGPFANLLRTLSRVQGEDPKNSPVRIALFTDRNSPSHERVIRTLRYWNVRIDEAFFLGGIAKTGFIKAFQADMFFDDREDYCKDAAAAVPTGRVLLPATEPVTGIAVQIEQVVSLESEVGPDGEEQFLLVCKSYLKRDYPANESKFKEWYRMKMQIWPLEQRSAFLAELEESVGGTPRGSQRRAPAEIDSLDAKLLAFIENLALKLGTK